MKSKTGAKVLGILSLTFGALTLITTCISYGIYYDAIQNILSQRGGHSQDTVATINAFFARYINTWFGVSIFFYLIWILFCALLLLGIERKNNCLMLPFMIYDMIGLVVSPNKNTEKKSNFLTFSALHHSHFDLFFSDHKPDCLCANPHFVLFDLCSGFSPWILLLGCYLFCVS